jgi:hypothetical protein
MLSTEVVASPSEAPVGEELDTKFVEPLLEPGALKLSLKLSSNRLEKLSSM